MLKIVTDKEPVLNNIKQVVSEEELLNMKEEFLV